MTLIEKYLNNTITEAEEKVLDNAIAKTLNLEPDKDYYRIEELKLAMVSQDTFKNAIKGCLEEEFERRKSMIHCDTSELQEFCLNAVAEKLNDLTSHICMNPDFDAYNGWQVIEALLSDTHKFIFSEELDDFIFFIFDDENNAFPDLGVPFTVMDIFIIDSFSDWQKELENLTFKF